MPLSLISVVNVQIGDSLTSGTHSQPWSNSQLYMNSPSNFRLWNHMHERSGSAHNHCMNVSSELP